MKLRIPDPRRLRRPPPESAQYAIVTLATRSHGVPEPRIPPLAVAVQHRGRTTVLAVEGEVDAHTSPQVGEAIDRALDQQPRRLVVDLSQVRFLDSAGLQVLLAGHHRAHPGIDFRVVAGSRATWRPLQLTRLHETLVIHASRAEAVAAPGRTAEEHRALVL